MRDERVAERTLYLRPIKGKYQSIVLVLERPRLETTGEWGCRVSINGLEVRPFANEFVVYGYDSVQALYLGMKYLAEAVRHSRDFKEGRVFERKRGKPLDELSLGLPIIKAT